jgi:hypothetical protein
MKWLAGLVALVIFAGVAGGSMSTMATAIPTGQLEIQGGDIPPKMAKVYLQIADKYNLRWDILAAIGKVETGHCTNRATSSMGAVGCMQFMPATWGHYGRGKDPYDPIASVDAAARYLIANGAPEDYETALFAYNHADWYVRKVLRQAALYRPLAIRREIQGIRIRALDSTALYVLRSPRITMTPGQRADMQSGGIDARVLTTLMWIAKRHTITITSLRHDHSTGSNHTYGRAFDIGIVDGYTCAPYGRLDPCGRLLIELGSVQGEAQSTELIGAFDPNSISEQWAWSQADHRDHIHVGWDGP